MELSDVVDYRYLTSIPTRKQSILIAYIVKSIKNQKGKPSEMELSFLKNDITKNLGHQIPVIYSKYSLKRFKSTHRQNEVNLMIRLACSK